MTGGQKKGENPSWESGKCVVCERRRGRVFTGDASSFAVSLPPLQDEEGIGPLTHPQRVSKQHLLWADPHPNNGQFPPLIAPSGSLLHQLNSQLPALIIAKHTLSAPYLPAASVCVYMGASRRGRGLGDGVTWQNGRLLKQISKYAYTVVRSA